MNNRQVYAKKWLGQHFLNNQSIARDIVDALKSDNKIVLEIGPGMGVLTQFLIQNDNIDLSLVEIDSESVDYLHEHYPTISDAIIKDDFLKLPLQEMFSEPLSIIGNFPYNISSQILFKVIENKDLTTYLVGMFQKEVAERIVSKPGSKKYGILSVLIQVYFDVEYLFTVNENEFTPPPKVKSAVIRMVRNRDKQLNCDEKLFKSIVKTSFNQRRKILRNSLKTFTFSDGFSEGTLFNLRPEQLSIAQFEEITRHVVCSN